MTSCEKVRRLVGKMLNFIAWVMVKPYKINIKQLIKKEKKKFFSVNFQVENEKEMPAIISLVIFNKVRIHSFGERREYLYRDIAWQRNVPRSFFCE